MAHDGTLLKLSFAQQTAKTGGAKPKSASQTTLGSMKKNLISAKAAFQKQLDDDGWAGDVADGVSALWGSKNRASVIRKELAGEQDRLNQLAQAAQKGDANFKTKFKQIYGVEYNKQAVEAYNKKPNAANFKKAYGSKYPDIRARVNEYNKSQQEGAEVVKTSAKVTTGVAIGVATGGAGLVTLGVAAGATTLASAGVEYSDRYKWTGGGGLRKGTSHKKIWKGAAWDGLSVAAGGAVGKIATTAVKGTTMAAKVGRGAINVAGDTGVGAAQEYSETGKVTATGVVTNATMGGVGSAVTSGVLKEAKAKIVRNFSSKTKKSTATPQTSSTNKNPAGIEIVPKRAKSQTVQTNTTKSGNSAGIEIVSKKNNSAKSQTVQTNTTKSGNSAGIEIVSKKNNSAKSQTVQTNTTKSGNSAGIEIVSKKNNSAKSVATKPDNQNILGEKFVDLSDSGVKIKQSEKGTVVVRDKVGNEWVTSLEKGETRPIVTDSSGKRFSITRENDGQVRIVSEKAQPKTAQKNIEADIAETKIGETYEQPKTFANEASNNVEIQDKSVSQNEKARKTTSDVEVQQQKSEIKTKSKPQTLDEVHDVMENIVKKQGARRKETVKPFDTKIENLKSKQVELDADFEAYKKSTKAKVAELQASNDEIMAEIRDAETVSREFPQRANILNRKIAQYRMALDDLEKAYNTYQKTNGNHGGNVRELNEFSATLRDKTQGGVVSYHSDSLNAIGKGDLPSYEYSEEIGELFHNYNISKDKASVVAELRAQLGVLEQQSGNLNSVIQSNNKSLAELKQKHSDNNKLIHQLDTGVKTRKDELDKSLKQCSTEIEELKQNRGKALGDLENTPEYKALNDEYKTLQQKARELLK